MSTPSTTPAANLGGTFTFPGTTLTIHRMGYGAMQLAGPHVFGPPKDRAAALAVVRAAIAAGINHIDTSDFYGPHITNQILRESIQPFPDDLVLVTKVGFVRGADASWQPATTPEALTSAVHDNLRNLGLERLSIVNLRVGGVSGPTPGSIEKPFTALVELQQQGLIQHLGLSNVNAGQLAEAQRIAPVVCVQNFYNIANRADDGLLDALHQQGIAFVPFFPLGGFSPLQSSKLNEVASALGATPLQVALAWLLHRSPNILLIPGTSSVEHLHQNLAAATLTLSPESLRTLDAIEPAAPPAH